MNILLDKICAKMPQLDGSQGCSVALPLNTLASDKHYETVKACLYEIICSKCIITRALEEARKLWSCPKCGSSGTYKESLYVEIGPYQSTVEVTCPDCQGLGIAREAFWEECPKCHGKRFTGDKKTETDKLTSIFCWHCEGTGQIHREPWDIVLKILKEESIAPHTTGQEYIRGQFFQLFWLWEQLRLTFESGGGREKA